jgi:hypothetical protein
VHGYARVDVADDEPSLDTPDPEPPLETAALLDQGEQLLAESARLLRRLDDALERRNTPPGGTPTVDLERGPEE